MIGKKTFSKPRIEVIRFNAEDIIITSAGGSETTDNGEIELPIIPAE